MATVGREIGTLVVVVLKARNLPNKRHIGKQDPFCSVTFNNETRRTKAIKRGNQHPEWDEEFRFTLIEDTETEDEFTRTLNGTGTPPPPPPKNRKKGPPKVKGGRILDVACFADDLREPAFIGETKVDLTEVLTKGETDEWFTLYNKEKYSGEVYLELTFWSNEPEPVKNPTPKPTAQRQYGGPGSFVPADGSPGQHAIDVQEEISIFPPINSRNHIPLSLRPSSSMAQLDLYVPPYETSRSRQSMINGIADDFSGLGIGGPSNRRQSFPPQQTGSGYAPRQPSYTGYQDPRPQGSSFAYQQDVQYPYNGMNHTGSVSYVQDTRTGNTEPYNHSYESAAQPQDYQAVVRHTGPRHSLPASSGFMPMPTPASSGFAPLTSRPSQQSGFSSALAAAPAPSVYGVPTPHPPSSASYPSLSQSSVAPSGFANSAPPPTPGPYHVSHPPLPQPPQHQPSGSYSYQPPYVPPPTSHSQQALPPPATSAPPHSVQPTYVPPPPPSVPPQSHSAPPEQYAGHMPISSSSHEIIPPPPPLNSSPPSGQPSGSRPLPQPTQSYEQTHRRRQSSLPVPPGGGPPGMYTPPARAPSGNFNPSPNGTYTPPQSGLPVPYNPPPQPRVPSASYMPQAGNSGPLAHHTGAVVGGYHPHPAPSVSYHTTGPASPSTPIASTYSSIPPPPPLRRQSISASSSHPPPPPPALYQPGPPGSTSPALSPSTQYPQAPTQNGSSALVPPRQVPTRRPSLPAPPTSFSNNQQQSAYHALPPPPPPPSMPPNTHYEPASLYPSGSQQTFNPGLPPRPPTQPPAQSHYMTSSVPPPTHGGFSPVADRSW